MPPFVGMEVAIVVFDGADALDVAGAYDVLRRLPGTAVRLVSTAAASSVVTEGGLRLVVDGDLRGAAPPTVAVVPGGAGAEEAATATEGEVVAWLQAVHQAGAWLGSANAGALVVEAAVGTDRERTVGATGRSAGTALGLLIVAALAGDRASKELRAAVVDVPGQGRPIRPYPGYRR